MDKLTLTSGRVVGRSVTTNKDGTKKVLMMQVEITDPEDIQSVELMNQTGEESNPPSGSRSVVLKIGDAWKIATSTDDQIEPVAKVGEKRVYSTNVGGDTVKAEIHLKNDGEIFIDNGNITIIASPAGELSVTTTGQTIITSSKTIINNDVDIVGGDLFLSSGTITGPNVFNGPGSDGHIHSQGSDSDGDSEVDTGTPHA